MSDLEGTTVGPYEVEVLLGQGGMGQVYRARDPRLEREVAIKVLTGALAKERGYLERFRREARAVAKLNHPHVVQVYDFGEQGDLTYLVMPLMSGGTLKDYLARRRILPLAEAVSLIEQVGGALQYAHERGLVHRDVKPANILMNAEGRALLSDFGIVRLVQKDDSNATLTRMGAFVGSPEYAAPEMIVGAAIDHRVDVYALGVMLYQMLTGRLPFSGPNSVAVMMQQAQQPPPLPRSLNPAIPPAVEAVMLKAMAKNPAERYQTAAEFVTALRAASASPSAGANYVSAPSAEDISDLPTIAASTPPPPVPGSGPAAYPPAGSGSGPPVWAAPGSGPAAAQLPGSGPAGWAAPGSGPAAAPQLPPTFATGLAASPSQPPVAPTPQAPASSRRRLTPVLLLALALILVAGGGATLALAATNGLFKGNTTKPPVAQHSPAASPTPTPRPSPSPAATAPAVYYMAHHFVVMNQDLENGDTVGNVISISANAYDAREGVKGDLYQNGTADMFGRASSIAQVVFDNNGNRKFVVLVDRIDTYQDAHRYFQRQMGLLQGLTTTMQLGDEAVAGIVPVNGQQTYQLFVRDVNIFITIATVPMNPAPTNLGDYFAAVVHAISQRGHKCTYTTSPTNIMLLPGNDPKACA